MRLLHFGHVCIGTDFDALACQKSEIKVEIKSIQIKLHTGGMYLLTWYHLSVIIHQ